MTNLYIDFDGVILNTIEITYILMDELKIDRSNNDEIIKFYSNLDWKKLLQEASQINDPMECIKNIIATNKYNVYILSHVITLHEAEEKVKYIRKYLDDVTFIPVPKSIKKTKMVFAKNSILIDDYSGNLKDWEEDGGIGIKFSLKLNGKGFRVINRLDQILEYKDILII